MRTAIAELDLPVHNQYAPAYGHDIHLGDDEVWETSNQDIWDRHDCLDSYSSDKTGHCLPIQSGPNAYGPQWLAQQCRTLALSSSGLEADALTDQISAILASDSSSKSQACATSILPSDDACVQARSCR